MSTLGQAEVGSGMRCIGDGHEGLSGPPVGHIVS